MLSIAQRMKKLISMLLVTLLVVTSTLTIFPSSASAQGNLVEANLIKQDGDVVFLKCESDCGGIVNIIPFAAGAVSGSAVTLMATGDTVTLAAVTTAIGNAVMTTVAPLATVATAPGLVPIAVTAAAAYGAYQLWKFFSDDHPTEPES